MNVSPLFQCEMGCGDRDCSPTHTVFVPTDDTWTVNPELSVGVACVDDAVRYLEGQSFATGPAQVDPLSLGGAA